MSTAGRPTFNPAVGNANQGGWRKIVPSVAVSAKDQRGHTKLKFRQTGQNSIAEVKARDLKAELEEKEIKNKSNKEGNDGVF
jgi:protein CWC15